MMRLAHDISFEDVEELRRRSVSEPAPEADGAFEGLYGLPRRSRDGVA